MILKRNAQYEVLQQIHNSWSIKVQKSVQNFTIYISSACPTLVVSVSELSIDKENHFIRNFKAESWKKEI